MSKGKIVLVTNTKTIPTPGYGKYMSRFDILKSGTNFALARSIKHAGYDLVWYKSVNDFKRNIEKHKQDLVFPYCHGVSSKIRQSFVQTFCENEGIKFVGAEAHTQTVANDKALSKDICRNAGIESPIGKIMFAKEFPPDIKVLRLPVIVKPQFEGDSIGISSKNVFYTYEGVIEFAEQLMDDLNQSVIIEEYIKGKELSFCAIGYKGIIKKIGVVEHTSGDSLVIGSFQKKFTLGPLRYKPAHHWLTDDILEKVKTLFHSLDKVEFMRVDFIHKEGVFYNIELTTDPDLSFLSSMYLSFRKDMSYCEFIDYLICNCKERYQMVKGI